MNSIVSRIVIGALSVCVFPDKKDSITVQYGNYTRVLRTDYNLVQFRDGPVEYYDIKDPESPITDVILIHEENETRVTVLYDDTENIDIIPGGHKINTLITAHLSRKGLSVRNGFHKPVNPHEFPQQRTQLGKELLKYLDSI